MDEHNQRHLSDLVRKADDAVSRYGLEGVRAEVVMVLDVSRSMYAMYKSHAVHELATRLLALSLQFDDDGVIPAYAFGDHCRHLGDLKLDDFPNWVEREVIRTGSDFQNHCMYAPAIHEVCSYFFPEDWHRPTTTTRVGRIFKRTATVYPTLSGPRAYPVYALFVTSGDCQDQAATTDAVRRSSHLPIFWQFVGLQPPKGSPTRFKFLEKLDNLGNTHVDNCGFFEVSDTRNDKVLFDGMAREFPSYLQRPEVTGMLRPIARGGRTTKGRRGDAEDRRATEPPDNAERIDERELLAAERAGDALERARMRRLAEARIEALRGGRPQTLQPRVEPEPTATVAALTTRTIKAVSETQTIMALADAEEMARELAQSEQTSMVTARDDDEAAPTRPRPRPRP